MARPEKYLIDSVKALNGLGRVTYPDGLTAYPKVERVYAVPYGTPPIAPGTADVEFTSAKLVEQAEIAHDQQYTEYFAVYETLPGPEISATSQDDETLATIENSRQKVLLPADPDPLAVFGDSGPLYVVKSTIEESDGVTAFKITERRSIPGTAIITYPKVSFTFPATFRFITGWRIRADPPYQQAGPFLGVNYEITQPRPAIKSAEQSDEYGLFGGTEPPPEPLNTWTVTSPASGSKFFPIGPNTIHAEIQVFEDPDDGDPALIEWAPESDPIPADYVPGTTAPLISSVVTRWAGNIYKRTNVSITEGAFISDHSGFPSYPSVAGVTPPT